MIEARSFIDAALACAQAAGWLGDTVDKRKLMAVCLFVEGAGILVLAATTTPLVLAAAVLLFSPAFGGTIPLRPALQAEHFGLQSIGTIQGLMNTVTTFGGFVGPILAGKIHSDLQPGTVSTSPRCTSSARTLWIPTTAWCTPPSVTRATATSTTASTRSSSRSTT